MASWPGSRLVWVRTRPPWIAASVAVASRSGSALRSSFPRFFSSEGLGEGAAPSARNCRTAAVAPARRSPRTVPTSEPIGSLRAHDRLPAVGRASRATRGSFPAVERAEVWFLHLEHEVGVLRDDLPQQRGAVVEVEIEAGSCWRPRARSHHRGLTRRRRAPRISAVAAVTIRSRVARPRAVLGISAISPNCRDLDWEVHVTPEPWYGLNSPSTVAGHACRARKRLLE